MAMTTEEARALLMEQDRGFAAEMGVGVYDEDAAERRAERLRIENAEFLERRAAATQRATGAQPPIPTPPQPMSDMEQGSTFFSKKPTLSPEQVKARIAEIMKGSSTVAPSPGGAVGGGGGGGGAYPTYVPPASGPDYGQQIEARIRAIDAMKNPAYQVQNSKRDYAEFLAKLGDKPKRLGYGDLSDNGLAEALIMGGLGAMGSSSPNFLQGISAGGMAGMKSASSSLDKANAALLADYADKMSRGTTMLGFGRDDINSANTNAASMHAQELARRQAALKGYESAGDIAAKIGQTKMMDRHYFDANATARRKNDEMARIREDANKNAHLDRAAKSPEALYKNFTRGMDQVDALRALGGEGSKRADQLERFHKAMIPASETRVEQIQPKIIEMYGEMIKDMPNAEARGTALGLLSRASRHPSQFPNLEKDMVALSKVPK